MNFSSAIEEEEPLQKRRLTRRGPTFTMALRAKRTKLTPKELVSKFSIREPAPKETQAEIMARAKMSKGKHVEITAKTLHQEDLEYNEIMAAVKDNLKAN